MSITPPAGPSPFGPPPGGPSPLGAPGAPAGPAPAFAGGCEKEGVGAKLNTVG